MDTQFKLSDGTQLNFEKLAEVVKYNGGNIKDMLDILANITPYGKKLLVAQDAEEMNHLLRAEVPMFYDESERTIWTPVGNPQTTTTKAKFGKALYVNANNYLKTLEPVTFGGNPFTIQCWLNCTQPSATQLLMNFGAFRLRVTSDSNLELADSSGNKLCAIGKISSATTFHLEIGYTGGVLKTFDNGTTQGYGATSSFTISKAPRTITIGGATGFYIDEFRLLNGVCAHTADFTPPTAKYSVTSQTVSLLHFD